METIETTRDTINADTFAKDYSRALADAKNGHNKAALRRAVTVLEQAAQQGHHTSLLPLASALLKLGEFAAARTSLEKAVDHNVEGAQGKLYAAHASGSFGRLSEVKTAWVALLKLAQNGDRTAQLAVIGLAESKGFPLPEDWALEDALLERASGGDGTAAAAVLRHYRLVKRFRQARIMERMALLRHPKLPTFTRLEEALHLAWDRDPAIFDKTAQKILNFGPATLFALGLQIIARINPNAYVRILQMELRKLGYHPGRISGYCYSHTRKAMARFCADHGLALAANAPPLSPLTVRSVSTALGQVRA